MKLSQELENSENQMHRELPSSSPVSFPALKQNFNEEALKQEIKQKYRNYLNTLRKPKQKLKFTESKQLGCSAWLKAIYQQLVIQLIPQSFRSRKIGEKAQKIMNRHRKLYCGDPTFFLKSMQKQKKPFLIILQEKAQVSTEYFQKSEQLFQDSSEAHQKLDKILQFEAISLSGKQIRSLEYNPKSPLKLAAQTENFKKYPVILVCRYNFLQQLSIAGTIELFQITVEEYGVLLDQILEFIQEVKELESQCKRQVLEDQLNEL